MIYFSDNDLIGCSMVDNTIIVDGVKYIVCKGEPHGIWCQEVSDEKV